MTDTDENHTGLAVAAATADVFAELVSSATITEITQGFWDAFLPEDAVLLPGAALPEIEEVRGHIDIGGSWSGRVEISTSLVAARRIAAALFGLGADTLEQSEVLDALGELVNVVGGNIKSILPAPTSLTIPRVADSSGEWRFSALLEREIALTWNGEPIVVRVWSTGAATAS